MKSINCLKGIFFILIMILLHHQVYATSKPKLVLLPLLGTGFSESEKQAYQATLEDTLKIILWSQ
ncbi:secreted protein [Candidatus Magnetomorum sp. HK-1]|nr:secreted protein [Candidatus Magnetomorum sp. HK-1]